MFSVSVMASKERSHLFDYLREKLGDVPFAIDEPRRQPGNIGIWENCKRAWDLHDTEKEYHLVIQDDAVICEDFYNKVNDLLNETKDQDYIYQLFYEKPAAKGLIIQDELIGGVAIMMPTKYIKEMKVFGDNYPSNQDDTKIKHFALSKKLKVVYPIPCFVDHRPMNETPTLTESKDTNRVSSVFI